MIREHPPGDAVQPEPAVIARGQFVGLAVRRSA
jgi:hypothetical protein